tara:strand:+ start:167 stop:418 length:252 start_codon:yes stop_codon:yes gene_type:complete
MATKLAKEELDSLQELNTEFNKIKSQLGDVTLQKHSLCLRIEEIKKQFQEHEVALMKKYGETAVINLETGEVKEKELEVVKEN